MLLFLHNETANGKLSSLSSFKIIIVIVVWELNAFSKLARKYVLKIHKNVVYKMHNMYIRIMMLIYQKTCAIVGGKRVIFL